MAGEFAVVNKYLVRELIELGLWDENMKNTIIHQGGSVQNIASIPKFLKDKYKTVWEIPMKHILEMSADRGAYICQREKRETKHKSLDEKPNL
jgi:ribonucleotide reductase alpha subunit